MIIPIKHYTRKLRIWSHLLEKSLMENSIFCEVKFAYCSNPINLNLIDLIQFIFTFIVTVIIAIARIYTFFQQLKLFFSRVFRRCSFSLVARYLLKFTHCSWLVATFARYALQTLLLAKRQLRYLLQKLLVAKNDSLLIAKICSLLAAKIYLLLVAKSACYLLQKLLFLKNDSLLNAKVLHYSLQKLLVPKIHSILIAEVVRCKKSLVARCAIYCLLVTEVACCKKSLVSSCKIASYLFQKLLVAKTHLSLVKTIIYCNYCLFKEQRKKFSKKLNIISI